MAVLLRVRRDWINRPRRPVVGRWLRGRLVRVPVDPMAVDWFCWLVGEYHWVDLRLCLRRPPEYTTVLDREQVLPLFGRVCYANRVYGVEMGIGDVVFLAGSRRGQHGPPRRVYVVTRRCQERPRPPVGRPREASLCPST